MVPSFVSSSGFKTTAGEGERGVLASAVPWVKSSGWVKFEPIPIGFASPFGVRRDRKTSSSALAGLAS